MLATILRVMRHDGRCLARDRALAGAAALFVLLSAYAAYNGSAWVRAQAGERAEAQQRSSERHAGLKEKASIAPPDGNAFGPDPGSPRYVGGLADEIFIPLSPLSGLSIGQADLMPAKVAATINTQKHTLTRHYEVQNPLNLLAGPFDFAFVIVYLYPLVIFVVAYDVLAQERESSTLALALSQPISLSALVAAKTAFRFMIVAGVGLALSLFAAAFAGVSTSDASAVPRLLAWLLITLAYGAFWFALALAVNALGYSSQANAVALVSAWIAFVAIVPSLMNAGISAWHPMPSRNLLVQETREAANEVQNAGAALLAKYLEDHPEILPKGTDPDFNDFAIRSYTVQKSVESRVAPVLASYDAQLLAQQAAIDRLGFLSPAILTLEALNEVAGTSVQRHRRFRSLAWTFVEEKKNFFFPMIFARERLAPAQLDALPKFTFTEEPWNEVRRRVLRGIAWLVAGAALLLGAGFLRLRRYTIAG